MPVFGPLPTGDFIGGRRNDRFVVDPDDLDLVRIADRGGRADVLRLFDRPDRTAGEFAVEGDLLVWRPFAGGGAVEIALAGGASPVEFLEWEGLAEDGTPYLHRLRIQTDPADIAGANFAAAGTQGDDVIDAPTFGGFRAGWSEVYGNGGNDRLTASNRHAVYLYGGEGNDTLRGAGRFDDFFYGDAGKDILRGDKGDDDLDGGTGGDRLFGGAGNDRLTGGPGNDRMDGGGGADAFVYTAGAGNAGRDRITGFDIGTDRVVLNGYIPGNDALSLRAQGGEIEITLTQTGTRLVIEGLTMTQIQTRTGEIFDLV